MTSALDVSFSPGEYDRLVAVTVDPAALCGIEMVSMGEGKSHWVLDASAQHANPMGTIHGGVLCDLGDAALSTAYMSTIAPDESFTTVDLTAKFLRPVWTDRLDAVGRVVHEGRTIGLAGCDITNGSGKPVARLSGICMTLPQDAADRREVTAGIEGGRS